MTDRDDRAATEPAGASALVIDARSAESTTTLASRIEAP
jgi:hypothetical protein